MKFARITASSLFAALLASCASDQPSTYDTAGNRYGVPDASAVSPPASAAANPIYDAPAVYEDSTIAAEPLPGGTVTPSPDVAAAPAAPSANGAAIIHTVVKGDTLSGISSKYKVPIASIKQANRMTNDIVVLGRKMVIPPQ